MKAIKYEEFVLPVVETRGIYVHASHTDIDAI